MMETVVRAPREMAQVSQHPLSLGEWLLLLLAVTCGGHHRLAAWLSAGRQEILGVE